MRSKTGRKAGKDAISVGKVEMYDQLMSSFQGSPPGVILTVGMYAAHFVPMKLRKNLFAAVSAKNEEKLWRTTAKCLSKLGKNKLTIAMDLRLYDESQQKMCVDAQLYDTYCSLAIPLVAETQSRLDKVHKYRTFALGNDEKQRKANPLTSATLRQGHHVAAKAVMAVRKSRLELINEGKFILPAMRFASAEYLQAAATGFIRLMPYSQAVVPNGYRILDAEDHLATYELLPEVVSYLPFKKDDGSEYVNPEFFFTIANTINEGVVDYEIVEAAGKNKGSVPAEYPIKPSLNSYF